jgi:FtsP/CotA-like multicopper oxidase with cupredoxin domain
MSVSSLTPSVRMAIAGAAFCLGAGTAAAADLAEPLTLQSRSGLLDILMVAKPAPVPALSPLNPTGWVYEICPRPTNGADACPAGSTAPNYYGGTRLRLQQGDTLKVHLVNKLPPSPEAKHSLEPGEEFLALNPTNIHTHGMLVTPNFPTPLNPTYGDNVFVLTFNSANGQPTVTPHVHSDIRYDSTDYEIKIPFNHPSGLFWFHPHVHGISLNQISAGMAGIITVGDVTDYVCNDPGCNRFASTIDVHHLILKDSQILTDGTLQDQEDPAFCLPANPPPAGTTQGQGGCPGQDETADGGTDYTGGRWFFTVNGQQYPNIPVKTAGGSIWRLTNASGSVTYDLDLWNPAQNRDMVVQVLSIDGVSVSPTSGVSVQDMRQIGGAKLRPVPCPGVEPATLANPRAEPLCVTRLHMMPSSRAEVWVAYRDSHDQLAVPPAGAGAVFRTAGFNTGPTGDTWPAVDLASVQFTGPGPGANPPKALTVSGGINAMVLAQPNALAAELFSANMRVTADPTCKPLPQGHSRRIFFNVPTSDPDKFGLGYEEVDQKGVPVPGTFMDVTPFDPMKPTVCLPLGIGNAPTTERWQLVNLAGEDHNFHIHQVKFRVLTTAELAGTTLPSQVFAQGVLLDNVPLQHADGTCNTVDDWRNGVCTAHPSTVEIPFTIAGDFVYHCHILEHEDGGMMARIRVRPRI